MTKDVEMTDRGQDMTNETLPVDMAERLFAAIRHGDSVHEAWLHEALSNFFAGKPVPPPRASTTAQVDALRDAARKWRCPNCHVVFERIDNVDERIEALRAQAKGTDHA